MILFPGKWPWPGVMTRASYRLCWPRLGPASPVTCRRHLLMVKCRENALFFSSVKGVWIWNDSVEGFEFKFRIWEWIWNFFVKCLEKKRMTRLRWSMSSLFFFYRHRRSNSYNITYFYDIFKLSVWGFLIFLLY